MSSAAGKAALVPLVAVTVVLGVSGVHGRRTHDPERAAHAIEILAPTEDPIVAKSELDTFFESSRESVVAALLNLSDAPVSKKEYRRLSALLDEAYDGEKTK